MPQTALDLTHAAPRSPNDLMAGIVSLGRAMDKARAADAGTLGEYHYDCPHDKPLFAFLGTDAETFRRQAAALDDAAFAGWIETTYLAHRSRERIDAFNEERRAWRPDPGSESQAYFDQTKAKVAPTRPEIVTWFDLLDIDEGRVVAEAHA